VFQEIHQLHQLSSAVVPTPNIFFAISRCSAFTISHGPKAAREEHHLYNPFREPVTVASSENQACVISIAIANGSLCVVETDTYHITLLIGVNQKYSEVQICACYEVQLDNSNY